MAWTDQCKYAFKTNVDARFWKQTGRKNLTKLLRQLQEESGIPWKTLYRWWNELENLKNEKNTQAEEIIDETSPPNPPEIPICSECNKNKVYVDKRSGKPYSASAKFYGLCGTCRDRMRRISNVDAIATNETGIECFCPKCNHKFLINRTRIK